MSKSGHGYGLGRYLLERAAPMQLLALSLLIWLGSGSGGQIEALVLCFCALLCFRLRDDLASIELDRIEHPERWLVCLEDRRGIWAFWGLLQGLCALGFGMGWGWAGALGFAGLCWLLELYYARRPRRRRSLRELLVLCKYPALMALLAARWPLPLAAMLMMAGGLVLFELVDDRKLGQKAGAQGIWWASVTAYVLGALGSAWGREWGWSLFALQSSLGVALLLRGPGWRPDRKVPPEVVFGLMALLWLV